MKSSFWPSLYHTLSRRWQQITEPSSKLVEPLDKYRARWIAYIMLTASLLLLFYKLYRFLFTEPEGPLASAVTSIALILVVSCYTASRTRFYKLGGLLT